MSYMVHSGLSLFCLFVGSLPVAGQVVRKTYGPDDSLTLQDSTGRAIALLRIMSKSVEFILGPQPGNESIGFAEVNYGSVTMNFSRSKTAYGGGISGYFAGGRFDDLLVYKPPYFPDRRYNIAAYTVAGSKTTIHDHINDEL